jgi:stage II sporulation protein M
MLKISALRNTNINIRLLIIVVFFILTGISMGAFTELLLSADVKSYVQDYLTYNLLMFDPQDGLLPQFFLKSMAVNMGLLLIIVLSGLSLIGFPAALLALLFKGASLGFSSTLIMDTLGGKGVLFVLITLIPPNVVIVPGLCCSALSSLGFALSLLSPASGSIRKSFSQNLGPFLTIQLLMAVFIIGGCFLEAFIFPLLQRQLI